jgi:hypothetical protein
MFQSQFSRKLGLAVAVACFMAVAGCSGQQDEQATNQASKAAPKSAAAKHAVAKDEVPKATAVSTKAAQPTGPVITVPKGTQLTAVVDQTLRSTKTHEGDTFAASLAAPVKVDGKTVLPKGAHVTGKVVHVKKNELKVELASITLHGKSYDLETNTRRPSDKVKTRTSAKNADKSKEKKTDNSVLGAKTELTFKLSKPVTIPAKG